MSDLANHQSPVLAEEGETEICQRLTQDALGSSQNLATDSNLVGDSKAETDSLVIRRCRGSGPYTGMSM